MQLKIFLTLYAIYAVAWFSILPMISFGMGAGKPNHTWWRNFTNKLMIIIMAIAAATFFVHMMLILWSN